VVASDPPGTYFAFVVALRQVADGRWYLTIASQDSVERHLLVPTTLVVRLWRPRETDVLRGRIGVHGDDTWAPFQSNARLEALVRAWLSRSGSEPP
jgi:hypothetical protein